MSIYTEEAERKMKAAAAPAKPVKASTLPPMFKAYVKRSGTRPLTTERLGIR